MTNARVKFGRRDFLGRGAAAAAAIGAAVMPGLNQAADAGAAGAVSSKPIGALARTDFAPLVGQRFMVNAPEQRVALTLVEAEICLDKSGACRPANSLRAESFSLIFTAPAGTVFESGTYQFSHPALGRLKLFTHPVGQVLAGRETRYQVVFG